MQLSSALETDWSGESEAPNKLVLPRDHSTGCVSRHKTIGVAEHKWLCCWIKWSEWKDNLVSGSAEGIGKKKQLDLVKVEPVCCNLPIKKDFWFHCEFNIMWLPHWCNDFYCLLTAWGLRVWVWVLAYAVVGFACCLHLCVLSPGSAAYSKNRAVRQMGNPQLTASV